MEEKEVIDNVKKEMNDAINKLKGSLASLRAGAVNPNVLDKIKVDYYGEMTPIKTLAGIKVENGTSLVLKVFDPTSVKAIEAAIGTSNLGVNPNVKGNEIRLNFPPLSGDRRKEIIKEAKGYCDDNKVTIRSIRKNWMDKVKKSDEFTEDLEKRIDASIQKEHDAAIKTIDSLFKAKEQELSRI